MEEQNVFPEIQVCIDVLRYSRHLLIFKGTRVPTAAFLNSICFRKKHTSSQTVHKIEKKFQLCLVCRTPLPKTHSNQLSNRLSFFVCDTKYYCSCRIQVYINWLPIYWPIPPIYQFPSPALCESVNDSSSTWSQRWLSMEHACCVSIHRVYVHVHKLCINVSCI